MRLTKKIWKYLILFSLGILAFLWIFQVVFINRYYEWTKKRNIKSIAADLLASETNTSIYDTLDKISYQENICIELTFSTGQVIYSSSNGRSCVKRNETIKQTFIDSNLKEESYTFQNPLFKDKSIMEAVKLNDNLYAFISTSLEPIDSTVKILVEQLIIVSSIVLLLSFGLAYFISKRLSNPIVKISKAATRIAAGNFQTKFNSNSDIVELVELTEALNEMKDELQKTEELQRDLMANVSHDLKTPLTMIKAYAEMIRDLHYNQPEKRNQSLHVIIAEVDRLTLLVNDILTLSKMQVALEQVVPSTFDLVQLIKEILKRFTIYSLKDGYQFIFEHEDLPTLIITADKKKIEQVIYNLLINALNYTGKDQKIIVRVQEEATNYLIEIIDSGKGIAKKELPHIWEKYYKDKKNHKRNIYGTGLGLAIVKHILVLHQYSYGVISKKGQGTTFYFKLPKETLISED